MIETVGVSEECYEFITAHEREIFSEEVVEEMRECIERER